MTIETAESGIRVIGRDIALGWGAGQIYRDSDEDSLAEFKAAAPRGEEIPDGGFVMFVAPWMEWAPWKKGHRVRFQKGAFAESFKAIQNREYPAYIYGDGQHIGYSFLAMANSMKPWGEPGSVRWWEADDGVWASFIPTDAPLIQDSIVANLRNGIIDQVSLGSTILDGVDVWNKKTRTKDWTVTSAMMRETSPVTDPKYAATKVYLNNSTTNKEAEMSDKKETPAIDADAIVAAFKAAQEPEEKTASFSAQEIGVAIGAAIGAMQSAQAANAEGAASVPQGEQPPAEQAQAANTGTDGAVINMASLKERLTKKGGK